MGASVPDIPKRPQYVCWLAAERAARRRLGQALRALTPAVERGTDFYLLDWRGLERLHGPAEAVAQRLAATHGMIHVGGAERRATAILAARAAAAFGQPWIWVPAGAAAATLAPWPLALLAPDGVAADAARAETLAVLANWGIRTLGQLAALPAAELHARLGEAGLRWRAWARGEGGGEALATGPRRTTGAVLRRSCEPPLKDGEVLQRVLARRLERLARWLERRDRLTDRLELELDCDHAPGRRYRVRFSPPLRQARAMAAQLELALRRRPPAAAVANLRLRARLTPPQPIQPSLFAGQEGTAPAPEATAKLLAQLAARLGRPGDPAARMVVGTPRLLDSHQPGAFRLEAFQYPDAPEWPPRRPPQATVAAGEALVARGEGGSAARFWTAPPLRPKARRSTPRRAAPPQGAPLHPSARRCALGTPELAGPAAGLRRGPQHAAAHGGVGRPATDARWRSGRLPVAATDATTLRAHRPPLTAQVRLNPAGEPVAAAMGTAPWHAIACRSGPWRSSGRWWEEGAWDWEHWDVECGGQRHRLRQDRRGGGWVCDGTYD